MQWRYISAVLNHLKHTFKCYKYQYQDVYWTCTYKYSGVWHQNLHDKHHNFTTKATMAIIRMPFWQNNSIFNEWHSHTGLSTWPGQLPDSKVHGFNMGPIWVLSAPDAPWILLSGLSPGFADTLDVLQSWAKPSMHCINVMPEDGTDDEWHRHALSQFFYKK